MKVGSPTFVGGKGVVSAIAIIVGGLFSPAYCQKPGVALFLQQTPVEGGVTTPVAGVYHFSLNSEVTLTAIPSPGYQFVYWLGDVSNPKTSSTTAYLDKPKIIIAVFEQVEYNILGGSESVPGGFGGGGLSMTATDLSRPGGFGGGGAAKPQKPESSKGVYVIPEPATGILLVLGSLFAFAKRRTKKQAR